MKPETIAWFAGRNQEVVDTSGPDPLTGRPVRSGYVREIPSPRAAEGEHWFPVMAMQRSLLDERTWVPSNLSDPHDHTSAYAGPARQVKIWLERQVVDGAADSDHPVKRSRWTQPTINRHVLEITL